MDAKILEFFRDDVSHYELIRLLHPQSERADNKINLTDGNFWRRFPALSLPGVNKVDTTTSILSETPHQSLAVKTS